MNTIDLTLPTLLEADTIIAFHIGRGGRFNDPGYTTLVGKQRIADFTDDLFERDGKFYDENGSFVGLTSIECESGVGRIELDGDYDTTYTLRLADIDIYGREGEAIRNAYKSGSRFDKMLAENIVLFYCQDLNEIDQDCILEELHLEAEQKEEE